MFNLETAIAEWRQRMRAAGIQSPVPLEELEGHLRDEVEQQAHLGLKEPEAFYQAVRNIGPAGAMRAEFSKEGDIHNWPGDEASVNRVLGALWIAQGLWFFGHFGPMLGELLYMPTGMEWDGAYFISATSAEPVVMALIAGLLLNSAGIFGGFGLLHCVRLGRKAVRMTALAALLVLAGLLLLAPVFGVAVPGYAYYWCAIIIIFNLITLRLLWPPQTIKASHV